MAHIFRDINMMPRARAMRQKMTKQESHLWYDFLADYPVHWYRQRIINSYIADFYCASASLIVEIDGHQHETERGQMNDTIRTSVLQTYGLKVIRFSNQEVEQNFQHVCQSIDFHVRSRMHSLNKE